MLGVKSQPRIALRLSSAVARNPSVERSDWELNSAHSVSMDRIKPKFLTDKRKALPGSLASKPLVKPRFKRPPKFELPLDTRSFSSNRSKFVTTMTEGSSIDSIRPKLNISLSNVKSLRSILEKQAEEPAVNVGIEIPKCGLIKKDRQPNGQRHCHTQTTLDLAKPVDGLTQILNTGDKNPKILTKDEVTNIIRKGFGKNAGFTFKPILRSATKASDVSPVPNPEGSPSICSPGKKSVRFSKKIMMCIYRKD